MRRGPLSILLVLTSLSCASIDRCVVTPKHAILERLESASGYEAGPGDADIRMALCGFRPARVTTGTLDGKPEVQLDDAGDHGSGRVSARLTLATAGAPVCEGALRFDYQFFPSRVRSPMHWGISNIARVGDPPAIVKTIEAHAVAVKLDEPIRAFGDASLTLPDGRFGTALAFEVTEPGGYTLRFDPKGPVGDPYVLTAYQEGHILSEGNRKGELGFFLFEAGKAILLASSGKVDARQVRLVKYVSEL